MGKYCLIVTFALSASTVAGCASWSAGPELGKITLEDAMTAVATGLNNMYDMRKDHPKSGLMPAEVTIVFNISASTKDEGKLYIEAGATTAEVLKIAKAGAEVGSKIETSRGNQVTIKFENILFAPKDTFIMTKTPEDILKLLDTLEKAGIPPMMVK